ncbi:MAG: SH3 domain-containing protein [Syntrophobacterales bacterium]|jgi:hypothetical protein
MEIINSFSWLEDIVIALGGVLCIYFGYRLFVLGASQTFKLFSHLKGWKSRMVSIAPGSFLIVAGLTIFLSLVTTRLVAIIQHESLRQAYTTKLILDELRKMKDTTLNKDLIKDTISLESSEKLSSSRTNFSPNSLKETSKAIVIPKRLNIRKAPGANHPVVGTLRQGDIIFIGKSRGEWLQVLTAGNTPGWVHGDYVSLLKEPGVKEPLKLASPASPDIIGSQTSKR